MCWGGLRGAVGLALAITVDHYTRIKNDILPCAWGSQVVFMVGGMAVLTLLINATTCELLLRKLGLNAPNHAKEVLLEKVESRVLSATRRKLDALRSEPGFYQDCEVGAIEDLIPSLRLDHPVEEEGAGGAKSFVARNSMFVTTEKVKKAGSVRKFALRDPSGPSDSDGGGSSTVDSLKLDPRMVCVVREVFLHVVRVNYQEQVEAGRLSGRGPTARALFSSVDLALYDVAQMQQQVQRFEDSSRLTTEFAEALTLSDWEHMQPHVE